MTFLFLNQTFHPDVASTAQYLSDLASTLVERGHQVTVVCSQRAYDKPSERYARRDAWRGVEIRRIACTGFGKGARWKRAVDFGTYLANCALHLLTLPRHDVLVGMTSPPLISWLGAWFARIRGGRFVFWVMDLNPDEALAAGWLREGSRTERVLQSVLRWSLHRSALVVALDAFMARRIEAKGVDPSRIAVIPPWSHDQAVRYDAAGRATFRTAHGFHGTFVVMYSGNHSPCHPLTTLLEAAKALRGRADIVFCFAGGGSQMEAVRAFAGREGLSNIAVLGYQPLAGLSASLSAADLHAVVMGDPFVGIVHPCKVHTIRALGIPYLYIGPLESHITELGPDFAARHGDVDAVVRSIRAAADRPRAEGPAHAPARSRALLLDRMVTALEQLGAAADVAIPTSAESSTSVHYRAGVRPLN